LALAQTPAQGPTGAQATSSADSQATTLAKQTQNPVFSLISVPLQANWDFGLGDREATGTVFNIQPAMPFAITPSRRPVNFQIAAGPTVASPEAGANWRFRFAATFCSPGEGAAADDALPAWPVTFSTVVLCAVLASPLAAQDLDPRAYANVPVDATILGEGHSLLLVTVFFVSCSLLVSFIERPLRECAG
jgi:hypothetical protein